MTDPEVFKAMPFGEDGLAGDGGSTPSRDLLVDATAESPFEELLEVWARAVVRLDMGAVLHFDGTATVKSPVDGRPRRVGGAELVRMACDEEWGHERPAGFWLLTEEAVEKVFLLELVEAYGDREGYVLIRAMKTIADHLAVKVVGDASVLKDG